MNTSRNNFMATMKMPRFNRDVIEAPDFSSNTQSGRVAFDERGNSIWEWQTAPGVFSRDISLQQLHALEANDLQVLDDHHVVSLHASNRMSWSRRLLPRKVTKDMELVMPQRHRHEESGFFEAFKKRVGLPA
jgi:hypothetical protein